MSLTDAVAWRGGWTVRVGLPGTVAPAGLGDLQENQVRHVYLRVRSSLGHHLR